MLFNDISIFNFDGHFAQKSGTVCAIIVEGIIRNTLKIFLFCSSGGYFVC